MAPTHHSCPPEFIFSMMSGLLQLVIDLVCGIQHLLSDWLLLDLAAF